MLGSHRNPPGPASQNPFGPAGRAKVTTVYLRYNGLSRTFSEPSVTDIHAFIEQCIASMLLFWNAQKTDYIIVSHKQSAVGDDVVVEC